ncbi:MAG: hypothetical protein PHI20_06655 [Endomicrobiaceae bacterium]|nr:hypothetical protein [Endomicrobiaceae bacterium]MDD3730699.1 hypothetical protein [Endomicrobiaceae bacterium]MDD4166334.1 hypothetical protein [Endomicrobiaceae bacterium]
MSCRPLCPCDKKSPFDFAMYDKSLGSMLSAVIGGFKAGLAAAE